MSVQPSAGMWPASRYAEAFKILKFPFGEQGSDLWLRRDLEEQFAWAGFHGYPWGRQYFL